MDRGEDEGARGAGLAQLQDHAARGPRRDDHGADGEVRDVRLQAPRMALG